MLAYVLGNGRKSDHVPDHKSKGLPLLYRVVRLVSEPSLQEPYPVSASKKIQILNDKLLCVVVSFLRNYDARFLMLTGI